MEQVELEQRTEWLQEFDNARYLSRAAVSRLRGTIRDLYAVGMDGLADKLNVYADTLSEGIETMNSAVSRSIQEDFDDSRRQIGETFKAIVEVATRKDHDND